MESPLGAAVIGVGMYGRVHVRTYKNDPRTQLKCVWSRTEKNAKRVAKEFGIDHVTDIRRIADDKSIHLVSIATPDFAHVEPALMMLNAGKHVLLEKPMATSTAECRRIVDAAATAKGILMVNFHNRWYPPFTKAHEVVASGELGAPAHARIRLSDRLFFVRDMLSWAGSSAPHWFLMSHTMDLVRFVFGRDPESAYALGHKGALKRLDGWRNNIIEFGATFYCEKGMIQIFGDNEGISISSEKDYRTPLLLDFITEEHPIRDFIGLAIEGRRPEWGTPEDGLLTTAAVEAVDRALETGSVVTVASVLEESAPKAAEAPQSAQPEGEDEILCPDCGAPMALRQGKYGPFLGCSAYPKCRKTLKLDKEG